jgi:hypothetical protein
LLQILLRAESSQEAREWAQMLAPFCRGVLC